MDVNDTSNYWHLGDIRLRVAERSDAAAFTAHFNTSPVWIERAFDAADFPRTLENVESWLSQYCSGAGEVSGDCRVFVIEDSGDSKILGYIDVWEALTRNGVFKTGIKMLDGKAGKGYATRAFARVLEYYFNELRYQKCDVYIYEFNQASLRFHKKFGFVEEGRLRREYYTDGRFYDSVCLGLTAEEFRVAKSHAYGYNQGTTN